MDHTESSLSLNAFLTAEICNIFDLLPFHYKQLVKFACIQKVEEKKNSCFLKQLQNIKCLNLEEFSFINNVRQRLFCLKILCFFFVVTDSYDF